MGINKFIAIDGTEFSFDQNVNVVDCSQSGTISQISVSYTPKDKDILIIHFANNVSTSQSVWLVTMGMVSYTIQKQDGSDFADAISAGTYLMLVCNTTDNAFYLLGSGSDASPLTTAQVNALLALI